MEIEHTEASREAYAALLSALRVLQRAAEQVRATAPEGWERRSFYLGPREYMAPLDLASRAAHVDFVIVGGRCGWSMRVSGQVARIGAAGDDGWAHLDEDGIDGPGG